MEGGGWRGAMGSIGGVGRTFGLERQFGKEKPDKKLPPISLDTLTRIARYLRPYWVQWLVILLCICVSSALGVLPPLCVGLILDRAIPSGNTALLGLLAGAMVGLSIGAGLVGVLQQTLTSRTGQSITHDMKNELFRHLQRMSLRFYTVTRSGEIVSRVNNDVNAVQGVATGTVVSIVSNVTTLAATATAMLSMNWRLTLLAITVVPAFYLPSRAVGGIRRRLSLQTQEKQATLHAFMTERLHVGGAMLMQIYGQREADAKTFDDASAAVRDLNIRQSIVGRWLFMILSVFSTLGPALIYWYGGYEVIHNNLSIGQLVAFAALLGLLYRPLMQLASVYVDIQGAVAVFDRIFEYLDMQPDVADPPDAMWLERVEGHILFDGVSFVYPNKTPPDASAATTAEHTADAPPVAAEPPRFALRDVSFEIKPGERVALVGPSGAGKTTTTYLVPRFYDPTEGRILVDGHDLRHVNQESLRSHVGIVTQETFLFHVTIRENLLYARPDATEGQIIDACHAANLHEFIASLPEGYDTIVGERGFRLSGGEKQRLSIARALLKDPSILILDEATSSLDATSEHLIQTALETLLQGRTSLIIAHRLSTILSADKIVVMAQGHVEDIGRHEELLVRDGLYAELFRKQFGRVLRIEGGEQTATTRV